MQVVKHTFTHLFVHLALFTGCALLIPIITTAIETESAPLFSAQFLGGILLILISAFFLYQMKESIPGLLQSLGSMIFLPGALNVLLSTLNVENLFNSAKGITGMSFMEPVATYYISHSVPTVLSVAAVYMAVGGVLYWTGHKVDTVKSKLPWGQ